MTIKEAMVRGVDRLCRQGWPDTRYVRIDKSRRRVELFDREQQQELGLETPQVYPLAGEFLLRGFMPYRGAVDPFDRED